MKSGQLEKRKFVRHPCVLEAEWEGEEYALGRLVRALDISRGGAKLHLGEPPQVGSTATITIHKKERYFVLKIQFRYIMEQDNGSWIIGGQFSEPLSEEEFDCLL